VSLYLAVKFLHILLAIAAVGFNASHTVWLVRARNHPKHLDFALVIVGLMVFKATF
jgi:heme A synthase